MNIIKNDSFLFKVFSIFCLCLAGINGFFAVLWINSENYFACVISITITIILVVFSCFVWKNSVNTILFDDEGMHALKKGVVVHSTYWDDYLDVTFSFSRKGSIMVTLYKEKTTDITAELEVSRRGDSITFGLQKGNPDDVVIISFLENKYGVSFDEIIRRK